MAPFNVAAACPGSCTRTKQLERPERATCDLSGSPVVCHGYSVVKDLYQPRPQRPIGRVRDAATGRPDSHAAWNPVSPPFVPWRLVRSLLYFGDETIERFVAGFEVMDP